MVPMVMFTVSIMIIEVEMAIFGILLFHVVICLVLVFDIHRTAGFRRPLPAIGNPQQPLQSVLTLTMISDSELSSI
jgi:hypothetical protein